MLIKTTVEPSSIFTLSKYVKIEGVTFKAVLNTQHENAGSIIPIKVYYDITSPYAEFKTESDDPLYSWYIETIIVEYEAEPRIELKEPIIFDEPKSFSRSSMLDIPEGTYLARYIDLRSMEISVDILSLHRKAPSIGGMFLFDVEKNYRLLSLIEVAQ